MVHRLAELPVLDAEHVDIAPRLHPLVLLLAVRHIWTLLDQRVTVRRHTGLVGTTQRQCSWMGDVLYHYLKVGIQSPWSLESTTIQHVFGGWDTKSNSLSNCGPRWLRINPSCCCPVRWICTTVETKKTHFTDDHADTTKEANFGPYLHICVDQTAPHAQVAVPQCDHGCHDNVQPIHFYKHGWTRKWQGLFMVNHRRTCHVQHSTRLQPTFSRQKKL